MAYCEHLCELDADDSGGMSPEEAMQQEMCRTLRLHAGVLPPDSGREPWPVVVRLMEVFSLSLFLFAFIRARCWASGASAI